MERNGRSKKFITILKGGDVGYESIEFPSKTVYRASDPLPPIFNFIAMPESHPLSDEDIKYVSGHMQFLLNWLSKKEMTFETVIRCSTCGDVHKFRDLLFYWQVGSPELFSYCPLCRLYSP